MLDLSALSDDEISDETQMSMEITQYRMKLICWHINRLY